MPEQTLHRGLTAERWNRFPIAQRLAMIASEFARASQLVADGDGRRDAERCYQRARELLMWTLEELRARHEQALVQRLEAILREMDDIDFQHEETSELIERSQHLEQTITA